jgi:hypothetical protein
MADVKFFIFASGVSHKGRIDFNAMADVRARELIILLWKTRNRSDALLKLPAILRFLHFDTTNGQICVLEWTLDPKSSAPSFRRMKKLPWVALSEFTPTAGPPEADPKNFADLPSNARAIDQNLDFGENRRAFNPAPGRDVSGILSITNVYHTVRGAPRKSVMELAMFGHGFLEGPVLINSFEDSPLPGPFQPADTLPDGTPRFPRRSDNDKDGRIRTDFHENMGEDPAVASPTPTGGVTRNIRSGGKGALTEFAGAFDEKAAYRIYGCDFQDVAAITREFITSTPYQVIREAYVLPTTTNSQGKARKDLLRSRGSSSSTNPVPANTPVSLDFSGEFANEIDDEKDENARNLKAGLPPSHVNTKDELRTLHQGTDSAFLVFSGFTVSTTWGDLIKYIARHTINTYAFAAADAIIGTGASTFKCLAAAPGMSSQNENNRVQRVCRSNGEDSCGKARPFMSYIEFYEKFLDLSSKEPWPASIQRNYGVFDKDSVAAIKNHKDQG